MKLIEELEQAYNGTTPGPWAVNGEADVRTTAPLRVWQKLTICKTQIGMSSAAGRMQNLHNAKFIATIHSRMPAILALLKKVEVMEEALNDAKKSALDFETYQAVDFALKFTGESNETKS